MKHLITGIIVVFVGIMATVWIVAERTDPKMLPQPTNFAEPLK
ncbi:MAG: hypothetical protein P1V51_11455 [Deltaproteobacteria bacterium]|nr:hypothetical protein [Deltaproteobacteria bacterium]